MKHLTILIFLLCALSLSVAETYLAPCDLDWDQAGTYLFVTAASGRQVLLLDPASREVVRRISFPEELTAAEVSADGKNLYVTGGGANGVVFVVDVSREEIVRQIAVGHTPTALNLSPDGKMLYVCNRFDNDVSFVDLATGNMTTLPVIREPVAADLTPDGKYLFVANLLPDGSANRDYVACKISVIDTESHTVTHIELENGAEGMRGIRVSPDGRHVFATSIMARFLVPATQLERG